MENMPVDVTIADANALLDIVNTHELPIDCGRCGTQALTAIGWLKVHRDMSCPLCSATIVLNTSRITGLIRSIERRIGELRNQLTWQIRKL